MMSNLVVSNGNISDDQYFLGTMLFIGNFAEKPDKPIEVIDGQQRLTTVTILFSALSDRFHEVGEDKLSEQLFNYIVTHDDNGEEVRILQSRSSYPYFVYFIQDRLKTIIENPGNEEEKCIKETYDYFWKQTSEKMLKKMLKKKFGDDVVNALSYVDILKALRDQVLDCTFISIAAADKDQANRIFAILNSKGKRLIYIDLIKNRIFEELRDGVSGTFAEECWEEIKNILNSGNETVGLATFFRHYWASKYQKCNTDALYENFNKKVEKNEKSYKQFLEDLRLNAGNYMKILNPKREDYSNRKEYFWLVQSLNILNKTFNIVQTRIALLALFDVKGRGIISASQLKKAVLAIENFHFAYNAICSLGTNNLEPVYSRFTVALRNCNNKAEVESIIQQKLIKPLDKLYPDFELFNKFFTKLIFMKKDNAVNIKTKYAINKLNSYFENKDIFEDEGSIEHILSENSGEYALNIGNLILLEGKLNNEAGQNSYTEKILIYQKSKYSWIYKFVKRNKIWTEDLIRERAVHLASLYFKELLNKELPENIKYRKNMC